MRVLITGATGTIGLALADALRARGDQVVALSRDPERGQRVLGDGVEVFPWPDPAAAPGSPRGRPGGGAPPPPRRWRAPTPSSTSSASPSPSAGATTRGSGS